jgi:hypothetical protein
VHRYLSIKDNFGVFEESLIQRFHCQRECGSPLLVNELDAASAETGVEEGSSGRGPSATHTTDVCCTQREERKGGKRFTHYQTAAIKAPPTDVLITIFSYIHPL